MSPYPIDSHHSRRGGGGRCASKALAATGLFLLSLLFGCGGRDELIVATYTPDESAKQAMAEYDTNHDGFLDAKELERCPALKSALASMDTNSDHRLSAEEIAARIQVYVDSQVAVKATGCHVTLDGKPLEGATVTYVPEKFMGPSVRPATGVSKPNGSVALVSESEKYPGAQPGFYRVQISKKDANGQETIPARYNSDSILGFEVYPRKTRKLGVKDDLNGDYRLTSKPK